MITVLQTVKSTTRFKTITTVNDKTADKYSLMLIDLLKFVDTN